MKLHAMLLDDHGRPLPGLGALRLYGGGQGTVDSTWSTLSEPPYRSHACSLIEVLEGSGEVEVDGRWWKMMPGRLAIIPCRRLVRRRTTGMRHRWFCWGGSTLADDLRLGRRGTVVQVDAAGHQPWCTALAHAGAPPTAATTCAIAGALLQASAHLLAGDDAPPAEGDPLVDAAITLLDRSHPRPLPMKTLARALRCSTSHVHARFAATLGLSPGAYIRERRIATARELLLATDLPVATVAQRCAFDDPLHFSRFIRHACGLAPMALRQRLRQDLGRLGR